MRREKTEIAIVYVAGYIGQIFVFGVIARTQAREERFCDNRGESRSNEDSENGTACTDENLLHAGMILYDEEEKGYIQGYPQPRIGDGESEMVEKGAVTAKKEMNKECVNRVMHGNISNIKLKIENYMTSTDDEGIHP